MGLRILIVEDDFVIATALSKTLKRLGHTVVASSTSGAEAIEQIKHGTVDLIFMDIRIRGASDGIETLARIKKLCGDKIRSIFMTGLSHDYKDPLLDPDAFILRKPFLVEEVENAIEIVMEGYDHSLRARSRA